MLLEYQIVSISSNISALNNNYMAITTELQKFKIIGGFKYQYQLVNSSF